MAIVGLLQLLNSSGSFAADSPKSNEQSVRDFVSAANLRKIDTMMNMVTDDVQWLSVVGDPVETGAPEGTVAESRREDVAAILQKVEDAWNKHDMQAFANLFHEDGVWVLWTGRVWTGRKAIEEGHVEVHRTIFRNSVQRERIEELTFIGPDAAVVRYCSTLTGDERSPDKIVRSRKILVVTRRDDVWRIGWGQNTRFADSTPDSPSCPVSP